MAKNVLVTGGAGFIGSHTVDLLISKRYRVFVIDNLSTGKESHINKKANFIFGDILDIEKNIEKFRNIGAVIHCAAQISVINSVQNPINDATNNVIGALKILEMCKKLKIKKFIFSSTGGAIYGNVRRLPISERQAESPESPYAVSKRAAEMYMDFYHNTYGMDCISLRYANVYGPRQDYSGEAGVIAIFINKLLQNQSPIVNGDGNQTRDFVYVEDVAEANLKALSKKTFSKRINIGTGMQTDINSLLSRIQKIMGKHSIKKIYGKEKKGEVRYSCLDVKLAKNELNWKPKVTLEEGLKMTIEWFKQHNH